MRASRPEPVPLFALGRVTEIDAGAHHVCAVHEDGHVSCWGDDTYGQLGRGTVRRTERPARVHLDAPCVEGPLEPRPR